eukprot:TRINITY_DN518_c0_g1_i1.p1 TRINITY_DN518_c0_g1~~TRINITY_DN518_c0_g1_i1.p1  ORF type:complete len:443 (+),score=145.60 TRINITY_DN518_c0_g1_i1:75-1403(+)
MRFLSSALFGLSVIGYVWAANNCQLLVPANPLTASGLATPYQLMSTAATQCNQATTMTAAFVQGAVINLDTGVISVYNPLVIDAGTTAATAPLTPVLPTNNVVGLWFGFNGDNLQLVAPTAAPTTLTTANCVNGFGGTLFGEFSYCNAPAFFDAANNAILNGTLVVPDVGTALDGKPCPTVRDFAVVDQDQSDNVLSDYLMTAAGTFAQNTPTNQAKLGTQTLVTNASDNRLIALLIDTAIGCTPWKVQDLAEQVTVSMVNALPLNEIQAHYKQAFPQALVPGNDPMVTLNGAASVDKINAYRAGVMQPMVADPARDANGQDYCQKYAAAAFSRIQGNMARLQAAGSPDPANTANLYQFLVTTRFTAALQNLNCANLGVANPFVAAAAGTNGGLLGGMNATLVLVLAITGGALLLIGVGAGLFIFIQRRKAATTAANNFLAL